MTTHSISVNINLNGLRGKLQRSLQKVICFVATGLGAKIEVEPDELMLPVNVKLSFAKLGLDKEQYDTEYCRWILSNGFRDAIENVSLFIESAHRVLSLWELKERQGNGAPICGNEWNRIFQDRGNKFHRLGFPDKLDHIAVEHGIEIRESYFEHLLSINVARNCFVHRKGIVSDRDANEDGTLKVKWLRLHTFLQNEDGEQELVFGKVVEKDSMLCVKSEENEKSFSIGDQLSFSVEEMSEIMWCFFLFGNELVMSISKFGENRGYVQAAKESST